MRTLRNGTGRWAAALMGAVCLCLGVPDAALAQSVPQAAAPAAKAKPKKSTKAAAPGPQAGEADAAAKDPAVALAAYTAGVKSYQAGKHDAAAQSLTTAINNGGLSASQMPKALYYRGAAYQQLGQSGQAISDLTSALWIKPGLEDGERAEATKLRSAAYRDAGLDESGQAVRAAVAPGETGSVGSSTRMSATASEPAATSSGIGNVFGSLFGGSSSAPKPPAPLPAPAPAAVAALPAPVAAASPAGGEPEVLPWSNRGAEAAPPEATTPKAPPAAKVKPPVKPAAAVKAAAAPNAAAPPAAGGGVRIQVASVKSRDEASAVIAKLKGMGPGVATVAASVDETTFGANTFYRVRLGPYASAAAADQPCKALKAGGLDCLVTPN